MSSLQHILSISKPSVFKPLSESILHNFLNYLYDMVVNPYIQPYISIISHNQFHSMDLVHE